MKKSKNAIEEEFSRINVERLEIPRDIELWRQRLFEGSGFPKPLEVPIDRNTWNTYMKFMSNVWTFQGNNKTRVLTYDCTRSRNRSNTKNKVLCPATLKAEIDHQGYITSIYLYKDIPHAHSLEEHDKYRRNKAIMDYLKLFLEQDLSPSVTRSYFMNRYSEAERQAIGGHHLTSKDLSNLNEYLKKKKRSPNRPEPRPAAQQVSHISSANLGPSTGHLSHPPMMSLAMPPPPLAMDVNNMNTLTPPPIDKDHEFNMHQLQQLHQIQQLQSMHHMQQMQDMPDMQGIPAIHPDLSSNFE